MELVYLELCSSVPKDEADCFLVGVPGLEPGSSIRDCFGSSWFSDCCPFKGFCKRARSGTGRVLTVVVKDDCEDFCEVDILIPEDRFPELPGPDGITPSSLDAIDGRLQVAFVVLDLLADE